MPSGSTPADPLFGSQWHLRNLGQAIMGLPQDPAPNAYRNDINVIGIWPDYTGKGVVVGVLDNGFQTRHPDLAPNLLLSQFFDLDKHQPGSPDAAHGTAAMGLILAVQNDEGGVGVAFGSQGIGYTINGTTGDPLLQSYIGAAVRLIVDGVDVSSNSWGPTLGNTPRFEASSFQSGYRTTQISLAQLGRDGLGIVSLFGAGNGRAGKDNTLYSPTTNSPYAIAVAAANADGTVSSYSTPGPNILVTAPGSGDASGSAAQTASIVTTDLLGVPGYNTRPEGDYTDAPGSGFNGTSAATPIAVGVVALMLEANPKLGYRDIQEILASSARTPNVVGTGTRLNWETNGATDWNGGGHRHIDDVGFGLIDARAAVRLAETWRRTSTYGNLAQATASFTGAEPRTIASGGSLSLKASFQEALRVQHVTVSVDLRMVGGGSNLSAITLELKGPNGQTNTKLIDPDSYTTDQKVAMDKALTYTFDTVRNWGEMGNAGAWTLSVTNRSGDSAVAMNASITLMGDLAETGRTLVYTDDYGALAASEAARKVVNPGAAGPQTLNAAAVTGNTVVDLAGRTATIAGVDTVLAEGVQLAAVVTGDGNDRLTGDATADSLDSGRGNDTLQGGGGQDTLSGGRGDDLVQGDAGNDFVSGGFGNDTVLGGTGNDLAFGDDDNDLADGNDGDDIVRGGTGTDTVFGSAGADQVYGEAGDDFVGTGSGNDFGSGGFGNDEVHGEAGNDLLFGDHGNDGVYGEEGDDRVYGGTGNDYLTGDAGNDVVRGEDGNDGLSGGAGDDTLDGGAGSDLLFGNAGDDGLIGGAGTDVFAFGRGDGLDRILDFVTGGPEADVIAFNGDLFADFAGVQAASRQDGADVVIAYGAGDALTLAGVQLGALSAANVTFTST